MADENDLPQSNTQEGASVSDSSAESTPQVEYSEVEQRAMEQGWVPEDQWDGRGRWRSAEDFLDRGELFSKIDEVKRRAERAERTLEDLKKHHSKVRETEYARALAELKAEKRAALEEGDVDRVMEIDDKIMETKEEQKQARNEPQIQEPVVNPEFTVWSTRNSWYGSNPAMKAFADEVGQRLAYAGERDTMKLLQEVERRVKKEYPEYFNNPARKGPSAVEGGGSRGGSKQDAFQLTPEETQVMKRFVKAGVMSEKEYIAEIKAQRDGA